MHKLAIFCKTYIGDLKYFIKLCESLVKYNHQNIPFYVSAPKSQVLEIEKAIKDIQLDTDWVTDEEIVEVSPGGALDDYLKLDGRLSQQVVKSEFWRLGHCENYLCIDSDSVFVRSFGIEDFMATDCVPYTVIHQSKGFLDQCIQSKKLDVLKNIFNDSQMVKKYFTRAGVDYDFGPTPVIWSRLVWSDLYEKMLKPQGRTLWDVIIESPSELRWYGEAYLEYRPFPLFPIEPLFKVYHYKWQYEMETKKSIFLKNLNKNYLGTVLQSNWHLKSKRTLFEKVSRKLWP